MTPATDTRRAARPEKGRRLLLLALPVLASLLAGARAAEPEACPEQRLKIAAYIESLCPDSRRFLLRQLVPVFRELGAGALDVELVPFGHASVTAAGKMVCQHGPRECEGNRRMACAIARAAGNQTAVVETVGCLFEPATAARLCVERHLPGASADDIERCTGADESLELMRANERRTGRPAYVPKITADDQYTSDIQEEAEFDLRKFACDRLKGCRRPAACGPAPAAR